ncbi:MAG: M23 family metallopeptidase [Acidobacteriota bacterium]|nr:M23 family metallopeptidase [Acidobacteriota bacterium]
MRTAAGFVIGFAAGVLVLTVFLVSTGRLNLSSSPAQPSAAVTATAQAPLTPPAPDTTMPAAPIPTATPTPLPAPPNPAWLAPPAETHSMPVNGKLNSDTRAPSATDSIKIALPLANLKRSDILDTFADARGGGTQHEAADILAPRGTPVMAVEEGNVVKLFNSKKGGLTVYQYDDPRIYCYYYAHLDRYAPGLREGMLLRKGDVLGYVGSTGDAQPNNPHLHFAILKLGPDKHWYEHTTAINPYPLLMQALH